MKYGDLTLGRIEALVNKVGGEEGVRGLLADELKVVPVEKMIKEPDYLTFAGKYPAIKLAKKVDPKKFYQTRDGLLVWSDFSDRIVSVAEPTFAGRKYSEASYWQLTKSVTGNDLLKVLSNDVWSATDFCAWLSTMLTKQSKGQSGIFLNNGNANLFLVEGSANAVFVVYVYWYSVGQWWDVTAWSLAYECIPSHRFFSKPPIAL